MDGEERSRQRWKRLETAIIWKQRWTRTEQDKEGKGYNTKDRTKSSFGSRAVFIFLGQQRRRFLHDSWADFYTIRGEIPTPFAGRFLTSFAHRFLVKCLARPIEDAPSCFIGRQSHSWVFFHPHHRFFHPFRIISAACPAASLGSRSCFERALNALEISGTLAKTRIHAVWETRRMRRFLCLPLSQRLTCTMFQCYLGLGYPCFITNTSQTPTRAADVELRHDGKRRFQRAEARSRMTGRKRRERSVDRPNSNDSWECPIPLL
ncbi:hypothetical protein C8J56DRAFT_33552 [Mycena floridula]|nr:hypothetical protein C8J56DRAFT_33552 [Mycena floridula]